MKAVCKMPRSLLSLSLLSGLEVGVRKIDDGAGQKREKASPKKREHVNLFDIKVKVE